MKIYIGCSILARSLGRAQLDGISIYSRAILECFLSDKNLNVDVCVIGSSASALTQLKLRGQQIHEIYTDFSRIAAWQALTNLSYPAWSKLESNFDLFHATDHLIPKLKHKPVIATVMDAIPFTQPALIRSR